MFGNTRVYLDVAAAHPVRESAARAYARAAGAFGNPSSPHTEGRAAKAILEEARTAIAAELQAKADDIVFTSGATEANNLAIRGLIHAGDHVLYHPGAHASLVDTILALAKQGIIAEPLVVKNGEVDVVALAKQIRFKTRLVSMEYVCGETGAIGNTREVKNFLESLGAERPYLHVDASQAPLMESIERTKLAGDLVTLDAAKAGGMRGLGVLTASRTIPLVPLISGGGQERGLRSGTEAPALAAAFAAALVEARKEREDFATRAPSARAKLAESILRIPNTYINEGKETVPNILNISFIDRDTDYLVALLDEAGFAVSTRSACESDSEQGSRAVYALTGDKSRAAATLRISWSAVTRERDLDRFLEALTKAVAFLDE